MNWRFNLSLHVGRPPVGSPEVTTSARVNRPNAQRPGGLIRVRHNETRKVTRTRHSLLSVAPTLRMSTGRLTSLRTRKGSARSANLLEYEVRCTPLPLVRTTDKERAVLRGACTCRNRDPTRGTGSISDAEHCGRMRRLVEEVRPTPLPARWHRREEVRMPDSRFHSDRIDCQKRSSAARDSEVRWASDSGSHAKLQAGQSSSFDHGWRRWRPSPSHSSCSNSTAVSTSIWIPSSDTKFTPTRVS